MKIWKKYTTSVVFSLFFVLTTILTVSASQQPPITVWLNGAPLSFDTDPIMESNRTLVPMRAIFEALGAEVSWEQNTLTAVATNGNVQIEISIDSPIMYKNGQEIALDVPARLISDRTMVPVRAISESFDASVEWKGETQQVIISTAVPETNVPISPETLPEAPAETENTEKNTYAFVELSPSDMQKLKESYDNLIRYGFEQFDLPAAVLAEDASISEEIAKQSNTAKQLVFDTWNQTVISRILQIQIESDTEYLFDGISETSLTERYLALVEEAGLEAHGYFDVSFETLADNSVIMLVTFDETDTMVACKYIGVVVQPDHTVRYFTAETDIIDKDALYFCEVTLDARGTIGKMDFDKEEFIDFIRIALEEGFGI